MAQQFSAAFSPGPDPGDPGSSPTSGSRCMEPASVSACVSASLSLSLSLSLCASHENINKSFKKRGLRLGGSVVEHLPLAQGVILGSWDLVLHQVPCMEPASPSACVSASLSVSLINK